MKWESIYNNFQKRKVMYILILLVITIILGYFAMQTKIDMGTYTLLPTDDETVVKFNEVSKRFGGFDNLILLVSGEDEKNVQRRITNLSKDINELETVVRSTDYKIPIDFIEDNWLYYLDLSAFEKLIEFFKENANLIDILKLENNLDILDSILMEDDKERLSYYLTDSREKFKDYLSEYPSQNGIVIENGFYKVEDTNQYLIFIRPTNPNHDMLFFKDMVNKVESVITENNYDEDLDIEITGMAKMMEEQQEVLNDRILYVTVISLLAIIFMFSLFYKRIGSSIMAAIPVVIGIIWTLGINYLVIGRLNLVTSIFSVIMLGLGIDFAIHFLTPLFASIKKEGAIGNKVVPIINKYFRSIFAGALTTSVAFFALGISKFKGLNELAFVAGVGILLSFTAVLVFMLLIVPNVKFRYKEKANDNSESNWLSYYKGLIKFRFVIIAVFLILIIYPFATNFNLSFNYNAFSLLPDIPSVNTQEELIDNLGISLEYSIVQSSNITDVEGLVDELSSKKDIGYIDSVVRILPTEQKTKSNLIKELDRDTYKLTNEELELFKTIKVENPLGLNSIERKKAENLIEGMIGQIERVALSESHRLITIDDLPKIVKDKYISRDGSIATFIFGNPNSWEEKEMKSLVSTIEDISDEGTGTPFMWVKIVDYLKSDLINGSLLVIVILIIMVSMDFKNLKSVIFVILPVTLGSLLLVGTMSLLKIQFNAANIAALPLIIGIGIDDGIHMVHKYLGADKNIDYMLKTTGKSVMITSFTTMIGFGSLYFVNDPLVSGLGVLLFLGVFFCMVVSLTVLPIVLDYDSKKCSL
ncbi:MAG: hypothetical protein APF84_01080 [Gracilibacter sp. BRH_c7a]|nr:MAG: hypothetical protein APF84_01080 [Gracilibacter sp. BRH_c7a]